MEIYLLNAFSKLGKGGSPTGVVLSPGLITNEERIQVVRDLGVSHVAFIESVDKPGRLIRIRFFTSAGELINCAHASIAAHALLFRKKLVSAGNWQQQTSGTLQSVKIHGASDEPVIRLQMDEIRFKQPEPHAIILLTEALGISLEGVSGGFPPVIASCGNSRFLVNVREEIVNTIIPDLSKLTIVCEENACIGAFLYSVTNNTRKATGRFFAPVIGVSEDIINGNSTGCVAAHRLNILGGNNIGLKMVQGASSNSEGLVKARAKKNAGKTETWVVGTACLHMIKRVTDN